MINRLLALTMVIYPTPTLGGAGGGTGEGAEGKGEGAGEEGEGEGEANAAGDDGGRTSEAINTELRPFHLFRAMLTKLDTDSRYQNEACRMIVSRLHFAFLTRAMERRQLVDRAGKLRPSERYDCLASCMWLLHNSNVTTFRLFIQSLQRGQTNSFLHIVNIALGVFRVDPLTAYLRSFNTVDAQARQAIERKKKLEESIVTRTAGGGGAANWRERLKDKSQRYQGRGGGGGAMSAGASLNPVAPGAGGQGGVAGRGGKEIDGAAPVGRGSRFGEFRSQSISQSSLKDSGPSSSSPSSPLFSSLSSSSSPCPSIPHAPKHPE